MRTHGKRRSDSRKRIYIIALLGFLVAGCLAAAVYHERIRIEHFIYGTPKVSGPQMPTTSLPAHPAANDGNKQLTTPQGVVQQPATDNQGQTPNSGIPDDQSKWLTSASGVITVKLPSENSTFRSGDQLYGSASTSTVQYRLIDATTGVISQGTVSVVKGNFSATLSFTSQAKSGRLDVFSVDSQGRETNEVQVPLKF